MAVVVTFPLTVAAVLAGGAGLLAAARWGAKGRVGWSQVAVAAGGSAVVGAATLAVGRLAGLGIYGVIHLAYLGLTVSVPVIGLGLLGLGIRRGSAVSVRVVAVALLVPAAVGAYATHVAPERLQVDVVAVPIDPHRAGQGGVRIAVLADLQTNHVGAHERRAVDAILASDPDVILVPGDLYQGTRTELAVDLSAMRRLLRRLEAPFGVYFVRGDTDGGGEDEVQGASDEILAGSDIRVLADEVVEVRIGDRLLRLGGTRLDYEGPTADQVRADLLSQPEDGAITVLMSHRPDTVLELPPDSRVDLTVAGHTHGGQVVVPGIGPLVTLSDVPRAVARGGLHTVVGNQVYVSPGVGLQRGQAPQVRLFSPPTVAVLELGAA